MTVHTEEIPFRGDNQRKLNKTNRPSVVLATFFIFENPLSKKNALIIGCGFLLDRVVLPPPPLVEPAYLLVRVGEGGLGGCVQPRHLLPGQSDRGRAEVVLQLPHRLGADHHAGHVGLVQQPGDGDLRRGTKGKPNLRNAYYNAIYLIGIKLQFERRN